LSYARQLGCDSVKFGKHPNKDGTESKGYTRNNSITGGDGAEEYGGRDEQGGNQVGKPHQTAMARY
jgi:hypothetical protein